MRGWIIVLVGLAVFAVAAIFGVISWEITLALIIGGLVLALLGVWQVMRDRRDTI
jgi:uncharacterized membrane protein YfcA